MSIRTKTRNRLFFLLGLAVVGTGALGGAYYIRRSYLNASALRDRDAGVAAVKTEDYASGLLELGHYLGRFQDKPESKEARYADALFQYALARQNVEETKGMHLVTAVSLWKRYLGLEGTDPKQQVEARHHLLDAQLALGWYPESLDTAENILQNEAGDLKSLAVKSQVLLLQRNFKEANAAAEAWAKAAPHDIDAHMMVVQAAMQQDPEHTGDFFAKYAAQLLAAEPNEPHFEFLASMAADQGLDLKDLPAARAKISKAAALTLSAVSSNPSDPKFVQLLVRQFDALWVQSILAGNAKDLGIAGKGLELARKSLDAHPADLDFQRLYALELLQVSGSKQVESFLAQTTPTAPQADGRLLAIKAFAEFSLNLKSEGQALLAAAEKHGTKDHALSALCDALRVVCITRLDDAAATADLQKTLNDPAATAADCKAKLRTFIQEHPDDAQAFADLKTILGDPAAKPQDLRTKLDAYRLARLKTLMEICRTAAAKAPSDPLVAYLLGEAALNAGDGKIASDALSQTLSSAPAWIHANLRMGQFTYQVGNAPVASQYGDIVHGLAPDDPNMLIFDTIVSAGVAAPGQTDQINKALALLQELQRRFPGKISAGDKQSIAQQLSRLGRNQDAIQFLTMTAPPAQTQSTTQPGNDTFMLAKLYAMQKRYPEAQALFDQLLSGQPNLNVIMSAADLAGALGQKDKVTQIMAKLDTLKPQPGGRELVWADYYSRHGTPQQAIDSWKAAIKANPADQAAWQLLLAFCLKSNTTDQFDSTAAFLSILADARKAIPDNPAVSRLVPLQDTPGRKRDPRTFSRLEELCQDSFIRTVIVALLESSDANDQKALAACLEAIAAAQKSFDDLPENLDSKTLDTKVSDINDKLIVALRQLVDDNPRILALQNYLVAIYGLSKHYDQCVAMATRAMQTFPDNPAAPAQTALRILSAAGRWDEALAVAKDWRQHSLAQTMPADLAIADALLNLGKPNDVITQLTNPYLTEIQQGKKTPDDYDQIYLRYLQALLNSSQSDAAMQAVTPLLKDRRWRIQWIQYMAALPDDKFAAASLAKLDAAIPADASDERIILAVVWNVLATRTKNASYEKNAFGILDTLNAAAPSQQFLQDFAKRILAAPQDNSGGLLLWAHYLFAKASIDEAQKAMMPLLDSANGRLAWIKLSADIPDANVAAQWLNTVGPKLNSASDSTAVVIYQKTQLARSFKAIADRANVPAALKQDCLKSASTLLEPIASQITPDQTLQTLLAMIYEDQENYPAAADVHRKMLKAKADDAIAMNNLANVLAKMKQPANATEALNLISQALKLYPKEPAFYDTQASVYALLSKDYPSALHSIQQAISLDPSNLDWQVSRICILALSGQRANATTALDQLKKGQDFKQLSLDSRQKLQDAGLQ